MRIGFDFRMGGTGNGGIGRYSLALLSALLKIDAENQYFIFFNPDTSNQDEIAFLGSHAKVELVPTRIRHYSLLEQIKLPFILNKFNLDLVHFPNFNVPIFYNKPFIVTIHDMVHHKISGHKKAHFFQFQAYKKIISLAAKNAKAIITVSHHAKEEILYYLNIPESKIKVIYEGATIAPQTQEYIQEVKKLFLLSRPYFLFVGTLERKKNIITLAKAFDLFSEKYNLNIDLVFVGKVDSHYPEIKFEALNVKNSNRIIFTGLVSEKELMALYQNAYSLVNASLHEGFGLPGVEAMQFGLPLVVSNTPVFNEIYDNAAMYFDPLNISDIAEKMHLIASDNLFYKQMQAKSFSRGQLYQWSITAEKTLEVYKQVFKKANESKRLIHEPIKEI